MIPRPSKSARPHVYTHPRYEILSSFSRKTEREGQLGFEGRFVHEIRTDTQLPFGFGSASYETMRWILRLGSSDMTFQRHSSVELPRYRI